MKKTKRLGGKLGVVPCSVLLGALTGCIGYVEQPHARVAYEPPPPVYARAPAVEVSFTIRTENDFYEPLTSYGRWEVVGAHGRCWIPGRVEAGWRPYSNGNWQRTDAGWYWASDEPWAWATYHYGRWDLSADFGWYWVPQTQWAPAWVSWHSGGGHIGWAPLQPSARIAAGGVVAVNVALIAPRAFVFVEEQRFLEPVRPTTVVVNNTTIINNTVNITNIKVVNNTVINEGPRTTVIEQVTAQKVQAVPVRELRRKQEAEVISRHPTLATAHERNVPPPARTVAEPRERKSPPTPETRAQESGRKGTPETPVNAKAPERKGPFESPANANRLEKRNQAEAERRAKESEKKRLAEAEGKVKASENKTQIEAEQRAKESEKKRLAETEAKAKGLEKRNQAEAERRAQESEKKGPSGPPAKVKGFEKQPQLQPASRAREQVADPVISSHVRQALAADPQLGGVSVNSSKGVIKLSGTVSSSELKDRAAELAQRAEGVKAVENNIGVRAESNPGQKGRGKKGKQNKDDSK